MSSEKATGLILRITDFSETSRICVWMTEEFGKLSTLAKGGRRLKGPFESALDLLSTCQLVFLRKSSGGLDLLTEARLLQRFSPQPKQIHNLYAGYYLAELLLALTEDYDPHPELYRAAVGLLDQLQNLNDIRLAVIRFELKVLEEIGQLPEFETCMACSAPLTEGRVFGFWVAQGGLICEDCQKSGYSQLEVHAGTASLLRQLTDPEATDWTQLTPTVQQLRELKHVTTTALSHILGYRPKTLKFLPF